MARKVTRKRRRVGVCVPTLDAGAEWGAWLDALNRQSLRPDRVLVVDSESTDGTALLAAERGHRVMTEPRSAFNHGGTRQRAVEAMADCDIIVFFTQDAVLASPDSLGNLVGAFDDESVAVAYGRQLPRKGADPLAAHARLFNYPDRSEKRSVADSGRLGLKAAFTSNSFAAYRRGTLVDVGGFPHDAMMSEDMLVAARLLQKGWKVAYCADATVFHSHDLTVAREFRRYFRIGALHAREAWLLEKFGRPEGEGKRFVMSEISYLWRHAPAHLPVALLRTGTKYLGYRLGRLVGRRRGT